VKCSDHLGLRRDGDAYCDAEQYAVKLPTSIAFFLQASIILLFLAGSSAPTPLYTVYQASWGFSPITVTVIFGCYAVAVLMALLVAGSVSDHVGRRPVLLATTLMQAGVMVLFIEADSVAMLIVARVGQGLATGLAASAVGAGMLDLDRERGAVANAVAPMLGTATGAILSGVLVDYAPSPTTLVYAVLGALYVMQFVGVVFMRETVATRPGAWASLRPRIHMPARLRVAALVAAPAVAAAWAFAGFYASLGPVVVRTLADSPSHLVGGLSLAVLVGTGATAVFLLRTRGVRFLMIFGTLSLVVGVALTVLAIGLTSLPVFFLGEAVAGCGFGCAFQGAIRSVVPFAEPHERAGVLSVVYIVAYLAMGVPAVVGGIRLVGTGDVLGTATEYGLAVIVFALLSFLGLVLARSSRAER